MRFEDRLWREKRTKTQLAQVVNQHESEVAEALTTFVTEDLSLLVRLSAMNYCENKKTSSKINNYKPPQWRIQRGGG